MSKRTMKSDVLSMMFFAMAGLFLGVVLFGWITGCGEHYIDAAGNAHVYECYK